MTKDWTPYPPSYRWTRWKYLLGASKTSAPSIPRFWRPARVLSWPYSSTNYVNTPKIGPI